MDKKQQRAIIIGLLHWLKESGSWCGETHIQKALYCLKDLEKVPTKYDFIIYKHGPFSFDLRDELVAMRGDGLLSITPYPYGVSFNITERGDNFYSETGRKYEKSIKHIAKFFGSKGVAALERLSTALFIKVKNPDKNTDELTSLICKIKPHIKSEQAKQALESIDYYLTRN